MSNKDLEQVASARDRVALGLTLATVVVYFGFILLVAWGKPLLGTLIAPGLSLGMLLGSLVILISWALTGAYVYWANRHYDAQVGRIGRGSPQRKEEP